MKKILAILLTGLMVLSLTACAGKKPQGEELWNSYEYGALYEKNQLTYGPATLQIPDFFFIEGQDGDPNDYLCSDDYENFFYVLYQGEQNASYEETKEEDITSIYTEEDGYMGTTMLRFEKSYLGDFPTIQYSLKIQLESSEEYITELIVLNAPEATSSIRLIMESSTEESCKKAMEYFDSVSLTKKPVTKEESEAVDVTCITMK